MLKPVYHLELREKKRRIVLLKDTTEIATLHFPKWHSSNAVSEDAASAMEIRQKGIWGSKFELFTHGKKRGKICFNWKQHATIQLAEARFGREHTFIFKPRGIMKQYFEVSDPNREEALFNLRPVGKWYCRNSRLDIELHSKIDETLLEEVLMYCGFAVRQHEMHTAAAVAAV